MKPPPGVLVVMSPVLTRGLFGETARKRLASLATLLDPEPQASFDDAAVTALLPECEVLLTGWGCPMIDGTVLARAPKLRAVIHAAGTVRPILDPACWDRKLVVSSAAAANAVPVAEYTLAAILMANKGVFTMARRYADERHMRLWSRDYPNVGNLDKRIGLIGASFVGRCVIELLRPFDFEVAVSDPHLSADEARTLGVEKMELDALLGWSDLVSLHAPLLPSTTGMLDAARLALMRDGATLVNTARGGLVDTAALEAELVSGRINAVIDTTEPEQLPAESPLYSLPNVFLTPHVAGALGHETRRLMNHALDELERYVNGEPFLHGITREAMERMA